MAAEPVAGHAGGVQGTLQLVLLLDQPGLALGELTDAGLAALQGFLLSAQRGRALVDLGLHRRQ